jgi:hypothetical protein
VQLLRRGSDDGLFAIFSSPALAATAKANAAAMPGSTAVPGLGDAAYHYNGVLDIFGGPVSLIQISSSSSPSAHQLERLAQTLLGS